MYKRQLNARTYYTINIVIQIFMHIFSCKTISYLYFIAYLFKIIAGTVKSIFKLESNAIY